MIKKMESQEQPRKLAALINKGSEVGGSVAGAAIGLAIAGPAGVIAGAIVGPLISVAFNRIGTEISEKIMGPREQARVGAAYTLTLDKIAKKIQDGLEVRTDDFFSIQQTDRSKSESILEGTLLKARDEYEEKKINCYSNFLANLSFDSSISFERGNTLLRILEQLSFRQIVILAHFSDIDVLSTHRWMISFKNIEELGKYQDFYFELMNIYDRQLLQQAGDGITIAISSLRMSPLGKEMCNLIDVAEIDKNDKLEIINTIELIEGIIRIQTPA